MSDHRLSYRYALRPKWILSHLFVLALVVTMVNLGFWQLRRLDQRRAFNQTVRDHATAAIVPAPALLPPSATPDDVAAVEWQRVSLTGTYVSGGELLVANRVLNGTPGSWVLSLLRAGDGQTVAVVRGFIASSIAETGALPKVADPAGPVEVTGFVQRSHGGGRFATDTGNTRTQVSQVDLPVIAQKLNVTLAPYWVSATEQAPPADTNLLQPVPEPTLDEGPHLSYAVQWFTFSAFAVFGYPLILYRNAKARSQPTDDDEDGDDDVYARDNPDGAGKALG